MCFGQFHSLYVMVWQQTPNIFFKTWAENIELAENFIFHKKNGGRIFSGSDETLKVTKNYELGFVGWLNWRLWEHCRVEFRFFKLNFYFFF